MGFLDILDTLLFLSFIMLFLEKVIGRLTTLNISFILTIQTENKQPHSRFCVRRPPRPIVFRLFPKVGAR